MRPIIAFIILNVCYHPLTGQDEQKPQLVNVNILKSFNEKANVPLSRFVEEITYLPIETSPEIILSDNAEFEVTDEFIIVKNRKSSAGNQILLFDKKTGKFIREIGKQGRGPDEFSNFSYMPFNLARKEIYALGPSRQILVYNLAGKNIDKIIPPVWKDIGVSESEVSTEVYNIFQSVYVQYYNTLDSNIFVGYIHNRSGLEKRKVVLFSKGDFLKVYPNYLTYHHNDLRKFWHPPGMSAKFYKWNNELFFIEAFCDTLYHITKDKLIPRYYFNFGKFNPPYSKQPDIMLNKHWDEYIFILDICENQNYIFFNFILKKIIYLAIIGKKDNIVTTCKIGPSGKSALTDDINGLMDVVPLCFTPKNEMVYVIKSLDLINWLNENSNNSLLLKESLPWLKGINEFSNPIVAIGKCKE